MTPDEKIQEQARILGGGCISRDGREPVVTLTIDQADAIIAKMRDTPLAYKFVDGDRVAHFLKPEDVTIIFASDGM